MVESRNKIEDKIYQIKYLSSNHRKGQMTSTNKHHANIRNRRTTNCPTYATE